MITLGIIGLGNGGANHVRSLHRYKSVRLLAIADIDTKLLKQVATQCQVPRTYENWKDLIDDKDIEAVVLATPPYLRLEMFLAAAKAGKKILAEKPLGINLAQARQMAEATKKYGVQAMVNFGTRNLPTYKKLRELIQSGKYGKPQWIWFKYYLPANPTGFMPPAWFWKKECSGGHLSENAGHAFDLICELMGPVANVTGTIAQLPIKHFAETLKSGKPDTENVGVAILQHKGGGLTVLSNGCNPAGQWGMTFDVITDTSIITVTGDRIIEIMQDGKRVFRHVSPVGWDPIPHGGRAFIRFATNSSSPSDSIATPKEGVRAMEIADATYRSAAAKKTVALKTNS